MQRKWVVLSDLLQVAQRRTTTPHMIFRMNFKPTNIGKVFQNRLVMGRLEPSSSPHRDWSRYRTQRRVRPIHRLVRLSAFVGETAAGDFIASASRHPHPRIAMSIHCGCACATGTWTSFTVIFTSFRNAITFFFVPSIGRGHGRHGQSGGNG